MIPRDLDDDRAARRANEREVLVLPLIRDLINILETECDNDLERETAKIAAKLLNCVVGILDANLLTSEFQWQSNADDFGTRVRRTFGGNVAAKHPQRYAEAEDSLDIVATAFLRTLHGRSDAVPDLAARVTNARMRHRQRRRRADAK